VRFAAPVAEGLPGLFCHIGRELLPVDVGLCAFDTEVTNGAIANASTTSGPRIDALLFE